MNSNSLDFEMINGNEDNKAYKHIYEKVGANLLSAFIIVEKKLRQEYGDIQILAEAYISEKDFLRKIEIVTFPYISLTLIEDKDGNVRIEQGLE